MLVIETIVRTSCIHGLGLFAAHDIDDGELIWTFDPNIDQRMTLVRVRTLPALAREAMMKYCYVNPMAPDWVVVCGDDARFMNFPLEAELANCRLGEPFHAGEASLLAARRILAGEELTVPLESDHDAQRKLRNGTGADRLKSGFFRPSDRVSPSPR